MIVPIPLAPAPQHAAEYKLQVCDVVRESRFSATGSAETPHRAPAE